MKTFQVLSKVFQSELIENGFDVINDTSGFDFGTQLCAPTLTDEAANSVFESAYAKVAIKDQNGNLLGYGRNYQGLMVEDRVRKSAHLLSYKDLENGEVTIVGLFASPVDACKQACEVIRDFLEGVEDLFPDEEAILYHYENCDYVAAVRCWNLTSPEVVFTVQEKLVF